MRPFPPAALADEGTKNTVLQGDSGGPLLRRRLSDDKFVLFGVLKGNNNSKHCKENDCYDGWDIFTTAKYFVFDICRYIATRECANT